jgi:hypothetical protein
LKKNYLPKYSYTSQQQRQAISFFNVKKFFFRTEMLSLGAAQLFGWIPFLP